MENTTKKNVIIDFYADWCAPCKIQKPILEKFASENNIEVQYVDVEEKPEVAQQYGVRSLPTLVYLRNGSPVETLVGLQKESTLKAKVVI